MILNNKGYNTIPILGIYLNKNRLFLLLIKKYFYPEYSLYTFPLAIYKVVQTVFLKYNEPKKAVLLILDK